MAQIIVVINFVDPDGRSFEMLGLCSAMMHISKCIHMGNEIQRNILGKKKQYNIGRDIMKGVQMGLAIINPVASFLLDPAFTLGFYLAMIDLTIGNLYNALTGRPQAYIQYKHGGYIIRNSAISNLHPAREKGAFVMGPFGFIGRKGAL
ncbi:MAG: hypothetical protein KatS3mg002_1696 [Candidatus Woesearchaeota archaeon]|nr:MAG: hypothetical protein KatS3mg002_1696 [Candidatus Woesearchaeota archaeon]GIX40434.1 MAG: hypothetical protein KatS3mg129_0167 [Leptospiraceae bacterium]